ncbi:MAG: tRNA (adenosine(37)-N6)-threonylcarbamoyltransferase complex ATPase subunit type 1 TsaE [Psychroserpens sp.]|nr:tRNA (adenosine(37)-N6)-threonylcarbamoyltransferase complex ATPase subunit type 1 TsaE [Psychroserpens sp.]
MEWTYTLDNIQHVANAVLKALSSKVVLFDGNMGVGKTTLIKAMVEALGSKDQVSSPTFSIVNEYESEEGRIYHFDMYRIEDEEEAMNFGFEDYLNNNDNWLFIEWPEKVESLLPEDVSILSIKEHKNYSRSLKLSQNKILTQKPTMEHC